MKTNLLYYGDNLSVLREHITDESVDLIYIDPPFNSAQAYNIIFDEPNGSTSDAQIKAFDDTWHWSEETERTYSEILDTAPAKLVECIRSFRSFLGETDMMAYLTMMAIRIVELHRVLKSTGSFYLHCDPTASHYLKVVLDQVFGGKNFRNEISWRRSNPKSHHSINFANCRDVILRYAKTGNAIFNKMFGEHNPEYVEKAYRYFDDDGRRYRLLPLSNPNKNRPNLTYDFLGVSRVWRWTKERMNKALADGLIVQVKPGAVPQYKKYLDESPGRTITNDWNDIKPASGNESLGYPTQKPEALLERIVNASSNEGDVVLDCFCGCGSTIAVAQRLNRRWIGIDITHLAISLIQNRLADTFGDDVKYQVVGEPVDISGAQALAQQDRYQFQWWALSLVKARPVQAKKKGADEGVDGVIYFQDVDPEKPKKRITQKIVVQVKSGKVSVRDIRELRTVVKNQKAVIGIFVTLNSPTKPMMTEAAKAGMFKRFNDEYPKIQIRTIEELLAGNGIEYPKTVLDATFKKAERVVEHAADMPLFEEH